MADNIEVEETTIQESPSVEQKQSEPVENEAVETPEESTGTDTTAERNWRAVREELDALKAENKRLKGTDKPNIELAKDSPVTKPYLTTEELNYLSLEEFKALQIVPELSDDSDNYDALLDAATVGRYRAALDDYARSKLVGEAKPLPSASKIAKQLKKEWDMAIGKMSEKAKSELAQQTQKAVAQKEATLETESPNKKAVSSPQELENLKNKSRQGDTNAIVQRLKLSGL